MTTILSFSLLIVGAFFILVAAIGAVRMPDLFLRMSATTKAATLGIGAILLAVVFYFNEPAVSSKALAMILFVLITAPVSAHMIGRAAYFSGVPLWEGTVVDELEGQYDTATHTLSGEIGPDENASPPAATSANS